ncbi:MAG TPA: HAMP domain-containing sensor histidine kinase [Longimicrobium sp.]|nr:HAMP domain-containing sensor histidine kinase [Longimicrobium sp.]
MSLRQRIVLTLAGIAVILVIPAALGLFALRQLHDVTHRLQGRDAEAIRSLGHVQKAVEVAEDSRKRYKALIFVGQGIPVATSDTLPLRVTGDSAAAEVTRGLQQLRAAGYGAATRPAERIWAAYREEVRGERGLIAAGRLDELQVLEEGVFNRRITAMDSALDPIAAAIADRTEDEMGRAEIIARTAVTTTLVALAVALLLTLLIGRWLTRTMLRPIGELRRGMGTVAEGNFNPNVRIPTQRTDELGDLARSFDTMTVQLRELDRLKAEFVSVASHEIKTPLSVIRGYVTLLADGIYGQVNDKQKKTLEAVSAQADRLARLVHRLLDVSRFEAGGGRLELREIALRPFFDELTSDFRVLAVQSDIDFPVRLADDLPEDFLGDEDRLNEVLGNLLSNAFKFTPRGGTIRLEARREDGGMGIEVQDTGVGIPADKLPRIFDKFYQVENEAQPRSAGTGLGLAIAREIVEAHGGTITAESQEGQGTRFHVFLPERPPGSREA